MTIDQKQQKAISMALVGIGLVGVIISVLVYLDNKKHSKIKAELDAMDRQIKALDLSLKTDEAKKKGVI